MVKNRGGENGIIFPGGENGISLYIPIIRQLYQSNEITRLSRSQIAIQCSHPRYLQAIEALQCKWSEVLQRPIEEIKEIQNLLVDSTDLSYMDADYLFRKNWEKTDFLLDIPPEAILESLQTLKVDTGITFGCDLGATLRNCPELMTLEPEIAFDRQKSFIGWGFEGHNLGNIIRYSPNAFLDDNADATEIKIQYMMMRAGADYEIVAESGLLELDPIEMAAKFEFLYRRGIIKRPTRKDYNREKKKYSKFEVEAKRAEMTEQLRQIYATNLEDFCEYAQCELAEFEMFCSLFAQEIEDCDGLATRDFHVLMGMKIPFRLDDAIVAAYKKRVQPTYGLVNKAFRGTREHGIQFIWYEDENKKQSGRSFLYEELAKDHNLNKFGDYINLDDHNSLDGDNAGPDRLERQYVKITHSDAASLLQSGH